MNSSFVAISTLIKRDIGEKCLINVLMNISAQALRDYLKCANIYKGNSSKQKTDLIEMNVYWCITEKLNKDETEDISTKQANQILSKNEIIVKSLPRYGNAELKKKEIKPYIKEKTFIKVWLIPNKKYTVQHRCLLRIILKIRKKKRYQK